MAIKKIKQKKAKTKTPDKETAIEALKKIIDPELHIDIWTLGLIYDMPITKKDIHIKMTFTSPMCPFGPTLVENVKKGLEDAGFNKVAVEVVFSPPWQPTQEVMMMLGLA